MHYTLCRIEKIFLGVTNLEPRPSTQKLNKLESFGLPSAIACTGDIGITPGFESILVLGFCQFGLETQDGFREFIEAVKRGFQCFQPAVLLRCLVQRSGFG